MKREDCQILDSIEKVFVREREGDNVCESMRQRIKGIRNVLRYTK